jgi:putative hydrolase of the HAD superfamily
MLRALSSGHRLGIVTNGPPDLQRTKISLSGLEELVEAVVISGEVGVGKPDQRIFRVALEALGVDAARAVMVGDNAQRDVAGARASGLRAIWVGHDRPLPKDVEPDAVIQSTVELPRGLATLAALD